MGCFQRCCPHPQDVCIAPLKAELLFPPPAHRVSPALCLPSLAPSVLGFFPVCILLVLILFKTIGSISINSSSCHLIGLLCGDTVVCS